MENALQVQDMTEDFFGKIYGVQEYSSPIRRVKLHKQDRKISYYLKTEDDDGVNYDLDTPELELTVIGITRKYELRNFDGDDMTCNYSTTEFPYNEWSYPIKVLDYFDRDNVVTLGSMSANDFKSWCEIQDDERREQMKKTKKGFTAFSKVHEKYGVLSAFKSLVLVYGVDKDDNLYRVELTSSSNESIRAALKAYKNKLPFNNLTTIKFEEDVTETPVGEFYKPILVVGKAHPTKDKGKYIALAQEFLMALAARQKSHDRPSETQDDNAHPFESKSAGSSAIEDAEDVSLDAMIV